MRVLRATHWSPDLGPITMVVAESSLKEGGIEDLPKPQPGLFTTHEVTEMDDPPEEPALSMQVMEAFSDEQRQRERNMAMLYYFNLFSPQADMISRGGIMFQSRPSPLSVKEIKTVFEQIAIAPKFKEKPVNMMALSEDMKTVKLSWTGEVKEVSSP